MGRVSDMFRNPGVRIEPIPQSVMNNRPPNTITVVTGRPGDPPPRPMTVIGPGRPITDPYPATYPSSVSMRPASLEGALGDERYQQMLALQNYARQAWEAKNIPLFYDQAFANTALNFDARVLQNNAASDLARLANAQYRDVDLARLTAANNLEATRRGVNSRILTMNDGYGIDMRRIADQIAAADRDYRLGMDAANVQNRGQVRDANNAAAAAGAASSTGFGDMLGQIRDQDLLTRRGLGNTLRDASDLNRSRTESAQAAYDSANRSVMDDWAAAQAENTVRMKFIDSVAKDFGITRKQMERALRDGMERLQMDYATTTRKIQEATESNDQMAQAAADAVLQQILAASMGRV